MRYTKQQIKDLQSQGCTLVSLSYKANSLRDSPWNKANKINSLRDSPWNKLCKINSLRDLPWNK